MKPTNTAQSTESIDLTMTHRIEELEQHHQRMEKACIAMAEVLAASEEAIKDYDAIIEALTHRITQLETNPPRAARRGTRNYGPKSSSSMNDKMAWRILFGDLHGKAVKDIAADNGFSRGQIYSVTGGYTFTNVLETSYLQEDIDAEMTIDAIEAETTEA